ncbi:MAG TPA: D-glycero-beta-D-manno-heptose 1,7-bisphosphate 7-phosphatase, partial [Rhodocyclaceae bacterium]|nr:D-glycero-beta-D-manno-heptose 1,7-bisphosphate 7-phosphatase [Rhodocyclaceae bacterium]
GYRIVVATNQSGVGRGLFDMDTLNAINDKMVKAVAQVGGKIDAIFFCPHPADSTCDCRKPKPGMFHQIAERFNIELAGVPAVGDSLRDLQAGAAAGCAPFLVLTGKGSKTVNEPDLPPGTKVFPDLATVATHLLAKAVVG